VGRRAGSIERLLAELNFELWMGDAAEIWVASWENRDLRQLLWHRHRMVQVRIILLFFRFETRALS